MVLPDDQGTARVIPRAVALYERDGGLRRRHAEFAEAARELIVRSVYTVGNYDYAISWIFGQDASVRVDVDLTGVMFVQGVVAPSDTAMAATEHGHLVDRQRVAIDHQHFFAFRLDFDVDGSRNDVVELNSMALPRGPLNPHGNAFVTTRTSCSTALACCARCKPARPRAAGSL